MVHFLKRNAPPSPHARNKNTHSRSKISKKRLRIERKPEFLAHILAGHAPREPTPDWRGSAAPRRFKFV